jgi:enterochelin esterase-like enzyme
MIRSSVAGYTRYRPRLSPSFVVFALLALTTLLPACTGPRTGGSAPPKASPTPEVTPSPLPKLTPAMPTASQAASTPECSETAGQVRKLEFTDPVMTAFRIPLNVYLPPCYEFSLERFPVVYLLHGYPQDEGHWLALGLQELLDGRISQGVWPGLIAVMPLQPEPYFTHTDGGPGSLEQVIVEGLVPYVDSVFRTRTESGARALVGISRGGVWALEIGLRHPQLFDTIAALSPALSVNHPRPAYNPGQIVRRAQELPIRIWISVGDAEPSFQVGIDRLVEILDHEHVNHTYLHASGRHEDAAWELLLEPLFDYLVAPWTDSGT